MKRVLIGLAWFVGIWLALFILASVALSVYLRKDMSADATMQQGMDAAYGFAAEHAGAISAMRWGIFLAAALAAILGTWKGMLPGTQQKPKA